MNGELIAEVDYGQMFLRLVYAKAEREPPLGDLYALPGFENCRDPIKKLVNAMLFSDGPLKAWPRGLSKQFPPGVHLQDVVGELVAKHPGVGLENAHAIGHHLFKDESDVLIEVIRRCRKEHIPSLPIHDAVLVPASKGGRTAEIMREVFHDLCHAWPEVTVTNPLPPILRDLAASLNIPWWRKSLRQHVDSLGRRFPEWEASKVKLEPYPADDPEPARREITRRR